VSDTCSHADFSVWASDTTDHPDLRGRVRHSLSADIHRGQQACEEFLVDFSDQPLLWLDADRVGDCTGLGDAGSTRVRELENVFGLMSEPLARGGHHHVEDDDEGRGGAEEDNGHADLRGSYAIHEPLQGEKADEAKQKDDPARPGIAVEVIPEHQAEAAKNQQGEQGHEDGMEGECREAAVGTPMVGDGAGKHDRERGDERDAEKDSSDEHADRATHSDASLAQS